LEQQKLISNSSPEIKTLNIVLPSSS